MGDQIRINESKSQIFLPSRLFIYYNERFIEGNISIDSGANIRDGIKSMNKIGVCPENLWKYDITKFAEKPNEECYKSAENHHTLKYSRVKQDINELKKTISEDSLLYLVLLFMNHLKIHLLLKLV